MWRRAACGVIGDDGGARQGKRTCFPKALENRTWHEFSYSKSTCIPAMFDRFLAMLHVHSRQAIQFGCLQLIF